MLNASKASGNVSLLVLFATIFCCFVTLKLGKKGSVVYHKVLQYTDLYFVTRPRPPTSTLVLNHISIHVIDELSLIIYENLVKIFKQLVEIFSHGRKSP